MTRNSPCIAAPFLVAMSIFAIGAASPVAAAPKGHGCHGQPVSRLSVTGTGETRVAPDMASIQLGVTTRADGADEAMRQNSQQQGAVIDALKGAGVAASDIQTSGLSLSPQIDYSERSAPRVTGYEARNMVTVRVTDLAALSGVLDAIVDAGANEINSISFSRQEGGDVEDEARRAAVADARHKAEVLAEAAGLTLGPVLTLTEGTAAGGPQPMMMRSEAMMASDSVPVEAGEVAMTSQVQIDYALVSPDCARSHHRKGRARDAAVDGEARPDATQDDADDGAAAPQTGD